MIENCQLQLQTTRISDIPLDKYPKDFTFIVNGERFETSRIIADLLSPNISRTHLIDPSINEYIINTKYQGRFERILDLLNFQSQEIEEDEIPFISEIIQNFDNKWIKINIRSITTKLTIENVIKRVQIHERNPTFYEKFLDDEIEFISKNFYSIFELEYRRQELLTLSLETLEKVLKSDNLILQTEDQLISLINDIYQKNSKYSILYEYVDFLNTSNSNIIEFITHFNIGDLTNGTWQTLQRRLYYEIVRKEKSSIHKYYSNRVHIGYDDQVELDGIINFLRKNSNYDIFGEIKVTSSSYEGENWNPKNVILYDDCDKIFGSVDKPNQWICFDFLDHKIIPANYTLKIHSGYQIINSWVVEASNDNENWDVIDKQRNCCCLTDSRPSHTFKVANPNNKEYRYIRIRQTGLNNSNHNYLILESVEFYGALV